MNIKEKFWIGTFISLWVLVSTVSTIHSIEFFELSNNLFLSWCLAIGFEIGAMASLGGIIISKGNKTLIWALFILLTTFQIHGNMYWAWSHSGDISEWTKLFDLVDEDPNFTKRVFAFISGGILPLVSLGFIKSLMDYLAPKEEVPVTEIPTNNVTEDTEVPTNDAKETPNTDELNKKNVDEKLSKLEDIVDNAEKVVNSIGEK
tara:strand:- start:565 stop:1176 length:612 start_codon:yes stop_codon:yes gene_type:complete